MANRPTIMFLCTLFLLVGCNKAQKECEEKCLNGYCVDGDCLCRIYWQGEWCDSYDGPKSSGGTNLTFWSGAYSGYQIGVRLGTGQSATITLGYFEDPSCGAIGCANFSVPPGTYTFTTSGGASTSGTVTVSSFCKKYRVGA